jgi:hypothetical protein
MNFKKTETQVSYYEDRITTNFEKHFNYLVLEDFYDGGYNDRIEDTFFYNEYFSIYHNGIINLLLEIENTSEEYIPLKIRLISLKRIIDNKLSMVENSNANKILRNKRAISFLISSNIDKNRFVEILYNQLYENKLIDVNLDDFKTHFKEEWDNIKWLGTEIQITNLISNLIDKKYLDAETQNFKYKLITTHFSNKRGKPFNEKQLGTVYSEKKEAIPKDDIILKIISEMSIIFH